MIDVRDAICKLRSRSMTVDALARSLGWGVGATCDVLTDMEAGGQLATCETKDGLLITLTEAGAVRFGLRLEGDAWVPDLDPEMVRRAKRDWVGELRCDLGGVPKPTILLGYGLAWDNKDRETCPACAGRSLAPSAYCLLCDNSGIETYARRGAVARTAA